MFARITKVSQYAVPAETVAEWLWNVRSADVYRRSERSAKSEDISHHLLTHHFDRVEKARQYETERLCEFQQDLINVLSVPSLVQVNTRVCAPLIPPAGQWLRERPGFNASAKTTVPV